ncbi:MAG: hypothetical protein JWM10_791 [Myxococcaceae bacterium]|nr:hypothetical protein [Myxococcaceae bacterium]
MTAPVPPGNSTNPEEGRDMASTTVVSTSPLRCRVIWKFTLDDPGKRRFHMPAGSRLIHVHEQGGNPCVWADVNPDAPMVWRHLNVIPTGSVAVGEYVGTVHLDGPLVFHIYDGGEHLVP